MRLFLLISCLFLFVATHAQTKRQRLSENVLMAIPDGLNERQPTLQKMTSPVQAMFASDDGKAEFVLNKSILQWGGDDIELSRKFYKANILNLYDQVDFMKDEIVEQDGKSLIVFEFAGTIAGEVNAFQKKKSKKDYLYVAYHILDEEGVLIFRFSCPWVAMQQWQEPVQKAMESIRFQKAKKKKEKKK